MNPNPALGVCLHWLGGLASASFYVPYRGVKNWAWETYWLVGGFFSWIIAPWLLAFTMTRDLAHVLHEAPGSALFWAYFFGFLWGLGGLTFGLTMRYLGMSLGMAVALGYTAAFGTLVPPIFRGEFASQVLGTHSGLIILGGVGICLLGIAVAGAAGISKEREMSDEQKKASIKEFDLKKGLVVATFSGVMSACFAYGLAAGDPIKAITVQHGTAGLWQGLPVLVVVLAGGFTTNFIWCVILNLRNHTGYQYFQSEIRGEFPKRSQEHILEASTDAPAEEMAVALAVETDVPLRAPMLPNYFFSAAGGNNVVHAVFLLHHGRNADGALQVLELDAAHGQHHHLQHSVGHCAQRVERCWSQNEAPRGLEPAGIGSLHRGRRLRKLRRGSTLSLCKYALIHDTTAITHTLNPPTRLCHF